MEKVVEIIWLKLAENTIVGYAISIVSMLWGIFKAYREYIQAKRDKIAMESEELDLIKKRHENI